MNLIFFSILYTSQSVVMDSTLASHAGGPGFSPWSRFLLFILHKLKMDFLLLFDTDMDIKYLRLIKSICELDVKYPYF